MKSLIYIFFFLLLVPSVSHASYKYIKVSKASNENQLWLIKAQLNDLGLNMTYIQKRNGYIVYTGPFKSYNNASYALKRVKNYFPHAMVIGSDSETKQYVTTTKPTKRRAVRQSQPTAYEPEGPGFMEKFNSNVLQPLNGMLVNTNTKDDNKFFVKGALVYTSLPAEHIIHSGTVSPTMPGETAVSYSFDVGYSFKHGMSLSIGILSADASEVIFDALYVAFNYRFESCNEFTPYIGVLGGASRLTWNTLPIVVPGISSIEHFGSLTGTQAGVVYTGFHPYEIFTDYQYMMTNHTVGLETNNGISEIQHNKVHNVRAGIQYNF